MAVDEVNDDDDTPTNKECHDVPADNNDENEDEKEDEDQDIEDEEDTEDDEEDDDRYKLEEVSYPDVVSKDALMKNLTDYYFIVRLICEFNEEENWDDTQDLRRTLLDHLDQIQRFIFHNNYNDNKDTRRKCFDFFLECLTKYSETPDMINGAIEYNTIANSSSMTVEEAQRLASTIALFDSEQSKHVALVLSGDMIFTERGTFACIFNSIVDNDTLEDLTIWTVRSIVDLEHGSIGRSNLATNTTLKRLSFRNFGDEEDFHDDFGMASVVDGAMRELALALRQNTGLQSIDLDSRMLSNHGRRALLDSLRDNCTLTELSTNSTSGEEIQEIQNDVVSDRLQSEIDQHMKLNKFWKRIQTFPYMDTKTTGVPTKMTKRIQTISVQIYPDVIKVLAKKPLLLYKFLRHEIDHTPLFGEVGKPPRRRRSARVRKKRRLQQAAALAVRDETIPLTWEEKELLNEAISKLTPDRLRGVFQMIRDATQRTGDDEEIDIDFDELDASLQRKLQRYVTTNTI